MNPIRHPLRQARQQLLHWKLVRRGLLLNRPSSFGGYGAPVGPPFSDIAGRSPNPLLETDRRSRLAAARSVGQSPRCLVPSPGRDLA